VPDIRTTWHVKSSAASTKHDRSGPDLCTGKEPLPTPIVVTHHMVSQCRIAVSPYAEHKSHIDLRPPILQAKFESKAGKPKHRVAYAVVCLRFSGID